MTNQQGAPKGTASDGKTELFNVPGYPLMVRAVDFNRLHAENERLQQELTRESHRTAAQKLRADQMTRQHADQAAMNREARAKLAALVAAQQPAIRARGAA